MLQKTSVLSDLNVNAFRLKAIAQMDVVVQRYDLTRNASEKVPIPLEAEFLTEEEKGQLELKSPFYSFVRTRNRVHQEAIDKGEINVRIFYHMSQGILQALEFIHATELGKFNGSVGTMQGQATTESPIEEDEEELEEEFEDEEEEEGNMTLPPPSASDFMGDAEEEEDFEDGELEDEEDAPDEPEPLPINKPKKTRTKAKKKTVAKKK